MRREMVWPLPPKAGRSYGDTKDTISPSALKTFQQCPEQFRRQYILGQWDTTSFSQVMGSAVHGAQEVNMKQKMITGVDLPPDEMDEIYSARFDWEVEQEGGVAEINWRDKDGSIVLPGRAKDRALPVNRLYHKLIAPHLTPIGVEVWFEITIPGVIPIVNGKIDLLIRGGGKTDMKFGGSAPKSPRKDWLLQAGIYNLADETPFEWHTGSWGGSRSGPSVFSPWNGAPDLRLESSDKDREVTRIIVRSLVRGILALYREFGPDDPWLGNGMISNFACDYCSFHPSKGGDCAFHTERPVALPELQPASLA